MILTFCEVFDSLLTVFDILDWSWLASFLLVPTGSLYRLLRLGQVRLQRRQRHQLRRKVRMVTLSAVPRSLWSIHVTQDTSVHTSVYTSHIKSHWTKDTTWLGCGIDQTALTCLFHKSSLQSTDHFASLLQALLGLLFQTFLHRDFSFEYFEYSKRL